jgi:enoyl-CoA hydratase/carnithine racemase
MLHAHDVERPEPRWPAVLAILAAAALHFILPSQLRLGQPEVVAAIVVALVGVSYAARARGARRLNEIAGYAILVVLTGGLLYGLEELIAGLVTHSVGAPDLLRAAAALWATNCLVFATWYWRLDAGGPNERERRQAHLSGAFLFPQMTAMATGSTGKTIAEAERWRPGFVDYLFVAFNASTAFSPTDVPVLSRWAKGAMMIQAAIAFTTVVLLVGRVVNIL